MKHVLAAVTLWLALAPAAAAEQSRPAEPKLAAAETAMTFAYRMLDRQFIGAQKSALEANQRIWARERDAGCGDKSGPRRTECLIEETEARRRLLDGEGRNGLSEGPKLQPTFFHEAKPGRYEIAVAYPQVANEHNFGDATFSKIAHDLVLGDEGLMREYRGGAGEGSKGPAAHLVTYDLAYVGPRLATVIFRHISTGGGLPHPFTARQTLVFDFSLGRPLRPEDLLFEPAKAVGPIAGLCKERLEKQAAHDGWALQPKADIPQVVNNFQAWAPGPFTLEILFDAGTIAPASAGAHECRIDYAALLRWLMPGGPIPPK
ncbi:MAG TPA: lysozyme inhibitor LprI family protein [Stellaceae bacterium]|jgi:hypothetical protein|nr:lysozyme inhibitor LprI family protein [Stellaceae bacterium]